MGLNYYAKTNICTHCMRGEQTIHIGKSSCGWKFAVEVHEEFYTSFDEFMSFINRKDIIIMDEYDKVVTANELMNKIEAKKDGLSHFTDYPEQRYEECYMLDMHKGAFS